MVFEWPSFIGIYPKLRTSAEATVAYERYHEAKKTREGLIRPSEAAPWPMRREYWRADERVKMTCNSLVYGLRTQVLYTAMRYRRLGIELQTLCDAVFMQLFTDIETYDPDHAKSRGLPAARQASILTYLRVSMRWTCQRVYRSLKETSSELAQTSFLEDEISETGQTLLDYIASADGLSPEQEAIVRSELTLFREIAQDLRERCMALSSLHSGIALHRLCLDGARTVMTFAELGAKYGCTRQNAQQVLKAFLEKTAVDLGMTSEEIEELPILYEALTRLLCEPGDSLFVYHGEENRRPSIRRNPVRDLEGLSA